MSDQRLHYKAGVIFDTSIDIGSSRKYGSAYAYTGLLPQPTETVTADTGSRVTFVATPDTTNGFKFKGWYNMDGLLTRSGNPYNHTIDGGDYFLIPAFEPQNPKFYRRISLTVSGIDLTRAITVSSMSGYYSYALDSSENGMSYSFNNSGHMVIPDGRTISVLARMVEGHTIRFFVNGNLTSPEVVNTSEHERLTGLVSGGLSDRSGESGKVQQSNLTTSKTEYQLLSVSNPVGGAPLTIQVVYTPEVTYRTIEVTGTPRNGGTVKVFRTDDPTDSTNPLTVEDGTEVTVAATPTAGYDFLRWNVYNTDTGERESVVPTATYTFNLTKNLKMVADFAQQYSSISVQSDPRQGGTVRIIANGSPWNSTTIRSNQVSGNSVNITATASENYTFAYWYEASDPRTRYDSQELSVNFEELDTVWVARFDYTPTGSVLVKSYTSTIVNGVASLVSGADNVKFKAVYTNANGQTGDATIGDSVTDMNVLVQQDSEGKYISVRLGDSSPYYSEENGVRYRYTLDKFRYADRYITQEGRTDIELWTDAELSEDGTWKIYLEDYSAANRYNFTLSGFYLKEAIVKVDTIIETQNSVTGPITTTGAGEYIVGDSVTVETSASAAQDPEAYIFDGWYIAGEESPESTELSYTFTVEEDTILVAKWNNKCKVIFAASPSSLGTVTCKTSDNVTVTSGSWLDYGTEIILTAAPVSGAEVTNWTNSGGWLAGSALEVTTQLRTTYNNIVARLSQSVRTLTVRSSSGGEVDIYTSQDGTDYQLSYPDSGSDNVYSISDGNYVRATATPQGRYRFSNFTLYTDGGTLIDQTAARTMEFRMDGNRTLDAVFSFVPWISTLGTIIKVY